MDLLLREFGDVVDFLGGDFRNFLRVLVVRFRFRSSRRGLLDFHGGLLRRFFRTFHGFTAVAERRFARRRDVFQLDEFLQSRGVDKLFLGFASQGGKQLFSGDVRRLIRRSPDGFLQRFRVDGLLLLAHGRFTFVGTHISLERFLRQVFDFRDVVVLIRGAVLNLQSFFVRFAHIRRSLASLDLQRGFLLGFGAVAFVDFLNRFAFQRFFAVLREL